MFAKTSCIAALGTFCLLACGADMAPLSRTDLFDVPIAGASNDELIAFSAGDNRFETALREADGLGPLYIRSSCGSCHRNGTRGPGLSQRMAVVLADGVSTSPDQSPLPFGDTIRPLLAAGAMIPVAPPANDPSVKVSVRVGPPLLGHGYMEAVLDSEIERVAAEQAARTDAIHGHINRIVYSSEVNPDSRFHAHYPGEPNLIGRFGMKARNVTLDDFIADALQRDIGITSPLRPRELLNPEGITDDRKPGVDVDADFLNSITTYVRLLAIPARTPDPVGSALFARAKCSVCHVPMLRTRTDYPIVALAGIAAPVYTDFLLHRWTDSRADGLSEGQADARQWRTSPLIGLRFQKSFLHDGSASSVEEAIIAHAGPSAEPTEAVGLYLGLPAADRKALLQFVEGL